MNKKILISLALFLSTLSLFSVSTSFYTDDSIRDFQNGNLDRIMVSEDGKLSIAPEAKLLLNRGELFVWDLARDRAGNIYAATGTQGAIYKIPAKGEPALFFRLPEGSIRAIVAGPDDSLYAASSPQGKLLRIGSDGKAREICAFAETYVWDMAADKSGNMLVATGTPARIYRVSPATGKKELLYGSDKEGHFLCLAVNSAGTLFFGSSGLGALYKKEENRETRLLFDTYEDEISAITITRDGAVCFATASQRPRKAAANFDYSGSAAFDPPATTATPPAQTGATNIRRIILQNSVYRVDIHDRVTKLLTLNKSSFHSLAGDATGTLYAGTGDDGILYRIAPDGKVSRMIRFDDSQVLALLPAAEGIYAGTGNDGKVLLLKGAGETGGIYTSRVYDCHSTVHWGTIEIIREEPAGTALKVMTRSGQSETPDGTWSAWADAPAADGGFRITSPGARYLQYRLHLTAEKPGLTPIVQSVKIPFLRQNRAPRVTRILFHATVPDAMKKLQPALAQGKAALMWEASDDDQDTLSYAVYFRLDGDPWWRLLREGISDKQLAFDPAILPDGWYHFKVVASDHPANSDDTHLQGSGTTGKHLNDNTKPEFYDLKATVEGDKIVIQGRIRDAHTTIAAIRYSLNARSWHQIFPVDQVLDSRNEAFRIVLDRKTNRELVGGSNLLILRAMDKEQNWTTTSLFFQVTLGSGDAGTVNDSIYFRQLQQEQGQQD